MIADQIRSLAVDIDSIYPDPANARKHGERNLATIKASLARFGQRKPIVVNSRTRIVEAGNGTLEAARSLGWRQIAAVLVDDDAVTATSYAIADNRTAELAEWGDNLGELLASLKADGEDLDVLGWSDADLGAAIVSSDVPIENSDDVDPTTDAANRWGAEIGASWRAGEHELICGDSSCCSIDRSGCLFYDPPWDADVQFNAHGFASTLAFCDGARARDVFGLFGAPAWVFAWDCVTSWYTPNRPLRRMKLCLWYGDLESYSFDGSHYGSPGEERSVTNSRGSYDFEPDSRGKHLSDLFSAPITRQHSEAGAHKHSKPLDWVRMLIANTSSGPIVDPFAGSGVASAAAIQLRRPSLSIEIDPRWCGAILDRWVAMGLSPERVSG